MKWSGRAAAARYASVMTAAMATGRPQRNVYDPRVRQLIRATGNPFLRHVRPRWATISTGLRNRFGHPHPQTLYRLQRALVAVMRTDRMGGVVWRTDGEAMAVRAYGTGL